MKYIIIIASILLLTGCGTTHYMTQDDTDIAPTGNITVF